MEELGARLEVAESLALGETAELGSTERLSNYQRVFTDALSQLRSTPWYGGLSDDVKAQLERNALDMNADMGAALPASPSAGSPSAAYAPPAPATASPVAALRLGGSGSQVHVSRHGSIDIRPGSAGASLSPLRSAAGGGAPPAAAPTTLEQAQSILESLGGGAAVSPTRSSVRSPYASPQQSPGYASAAAAAAVPTSPILDPPSLEELAQWLSQDGGGSAAPVAESNQPSAEPAAAAAAVAATPLPTAVAAAATPLPAAAAQQRSPSQRGLLPDGVDRDLLESLIRGATPAATVDAGAAAATASSRAQMSAIKGVAEMEAEWDAAERERQRRQLENITELSRRGRVPAEAVTEAEQLTRGVSTLLHDLDVSAVPADVAAQVSQFSALSMAGPDAQLSAAQVEALETAYMLASNGANAEMLSAALANQLLPCFLESQTGLPLSFSEFIKLVRMSKHALRTGVGVAIDYNRLRRETDSQREEIDRLSARRTQLQHSLAFDDAAGSSSAPPSESVAAQAEAATIMRGQQGQATDRNATVSTSDSGDSDSMRQAVVVRLQLQVYSLRSEISEYQRKLRAASLSADSGTAGTAAEKSSGEASSSSAASSSSDKSAEDGGDGKQSGIAQYLTKKNAQLEAELTAAKTGMTSSASEVR